MPENSVYPIALWRIYLLRAMYLFVVAGLATYLWPDMLNSAHHWALAEGYSNCMLAAFSLLCALGIRYPLRMLPVLLWEVTWKTLWLLLVPFAQWRAGHLDPSLAPAIFAVGMVVIVYLAIPWDYIYRHYIKASSERWR